MARSRKPEREAVYESPGYLELLQRLATNVRELRVARGMTQEEAGEATQMSDRMIQRIETAKTNATLATLARLADGLDVDVVALLAPRRRR